MKAIVEKGRISISVVELLENLSTEEKLDLADSLACENDVIEFVTQQIIDGWTEAGSHGAKHGGYSKWQRGLSLAITRVSDASGEVARKELERLRADLEQMDERNREYTHFIYSPPHGSCDICLKVSTNGGRRSPATPHPERQEEGE